MGDVKSFLSHMERFSEYGYTLVAVILGYDLGLFNSLKDSKKPLTSTELADISGYKERYVREWLGAMSAAKVISVESNEDLEGSCVYNISEDHFNIVKSCTVFGKGIFACYSRMGILKSCFEKHGSPGDAKAFQGDTWEFFEEFREQTGDKEMVNTILPKVESIMDFKLHFEKGCRVLDLGCGSGTFTLSMAERYPKSTFVGIDVVEGCLHRASFQCQRKGLSNVRFMKTTLESFTEDLEDKLDIVTCYLVLHNLPDPITVIRHIYTSLKPSGKLILLEVDISSNHLHNIGNMCDALNYAFSLFFCLPYSMSDKPHIGYGSGWGTENMLKCLDQYFVLGTSFKVGYSSGLHLLSKRPNLL